MLLDRTSCDPLYRKAIRVSVGGSLIVPFARAGSALDLVEALAALSEEEQLELCDALVDDPRLRDLLEAIDDYLYLEDEDEPPLNLGLDRELN